MTANISAAAPSLSPFMAMIISPDGKARTVAAMVEESPPTARDAQGRREAGPLGPQEGRREPFRRRAPACASYQATSPSAPRPE